MNHELDDDFWEDLLILLDEGKVIPVFGSGHPSIPGWQKDWRINSGYPLRN